MRYLALWGGATSLAIIGVSNVALWWTSRGLVIDGDPHDLDELALALAEDDRVSVVVIVPGARVFSDGRPSRPLADRLHAGAAVFDRGLAGHVLVSGDNRVRHYDEPTIMRREAHLRGVPLSDISVDYAGFDTWDTCIRAREVFGADRVVFVTQQRYANRSASLCRAAGLDVVVLAIPNPPRYPRGVWLRAVAREPVAAVKGLFEVLTKPDPTFGGAFEGLEGSETPANADPALGEV